MSIVPFLTFLSSNPKLLRKLFTEQFWIATTKLSDTLYQVIRLLYLTQWNVNLIELISVNKEFHEWFLQDIKSVVENFFTPSTRKIQNWYRYIKVYRVRNLNNARNFHLLSEDEKKIAAWRLCLRDSRNVNHCSAEILKSFTLEQWLVLINKDARTYVKLPNRYKTHVYVGPYFAMLLQKKGNGYYNDMIPWDALGIQSPH